MAEVKCPMCSKPNPEELDVCQFCEARLKPLTAELSNSQTPIRSGEDPKVIDTSQLESELPQWLRDVRQQARDSAEDEPDEAPDEAPEQAPVEEEAVPPEETPDLLAGLQSQADSEEEIPDWLSGLRGEAAQTAPEEESAEDDDLAALKSMLGEETPEVGDSKASEVPDLIPTLKPTRWMRMDFPTYWRVSLKKIDTAGSRINRTRIGF